MMRAKRSCRQWLTTCTTPSPLQQKPVLYAESKDQTKEDSYPKTYERQNAHSGDMQKYRNTFAIKLLHKAYNQHQGVNTFDDQAFLKAYYHSS